MERNLKQDAQNLYFVGNFLIYFTGIKITSSQSVVDGVWDSSGVSTGGQARLKLCAQMPHKEGLGCSLSPDPGKPDKQQMKMEVSGV